MKKPVLLILSLLAATPPARAATFMPQASFPLALATIQALDKDAAGNLYALGKAAGSATYSVAMYQTQGLQPLLSFDTGSTSPVVLSVEATGNPDLLVIDSNTGAFSLKRFSNTGAMLGQTAIPYAIERYYAYSAAIDKANKWVYIAKFWSITPCFDLLGGCSGPPAGTRGYVYQYDFQGILLRTITLPGNTSSNGSCYEPRAMTVDPQGNLFVADSYCKHLLRYSSTGALLSDSPVSAYFYPTSIWTDSASSVYSSQYVCTGTGLANCLPGIAKFSADGTQLASAATDAQNGVNAGTSWDTRIVYLSSFGAPPLRRFVYDDPPAVPVQTAPVGAVVQHSSAAALAWQQSSDSDGDQVSYALYLGTSPAGLKPVGNTGGISWMSAPLSFGTTYFWQVVAQDSYLGLPVTTTPSPIASFNLDLTNLPPADFGVRSGAGAAVTRATTVNLAWDPAIDPEGDGVSYTLSWRPSGQLAPTVLVTTATAQTMSGLSFGTTYFWSVLAKDDYGATRPMASGATQAYLPVFLNNAPPAPVVTEGTGVSSQHTLTPVVHLNWSTSADPEGDAVNYRLSLGTSTSALALVQDGTGTTYDLSPIFGATYYWQVAAYDSYGASSAAPVASILTLLQNSPPAAFGPVSGVGTTLTRSTSVNLSWQSALDLDGDAVTYTLSWWPAGQVSPNVSVTTATSSQPLTGLAFGTTYFWSVVAHDAYGGSQPLAGGTTQAYTPVFLNNPPPAPVITDGTGVTSQHTLTPAVHLSWAASADPEGDAVGYLLAVGTNPSALTPVQDGVETSYELNPLFGTTYYWQVTAYDTYGASSATAMAKILTLLQNNPPALFTAMSGAGSSATRDTSVDLSWQTASDADGDAVTYTLTWQPATQSSPTVIVTTATFQRMSGLSFGTSYYWSVVAQDIYGGAQPLAGGATQLYLPVFNNTPPPLPTINAGSGVTSLHTLTPQLVLSWSAVQDAEGDTVTYRVALGTSPAALATVQDSTATAYALTPIFGTTYYWQVTAYDPFGAASTTPATTLRALLRNAAPEPFEVLTGTGTVATRDTSWPLTWTASADADGDPVTYELALSTSPQSLPVVQASTATSYTLGFQYGTTYYWQVTARDGFGGVTSSDLQVFRADFLNIAPAQPTLSAPFMSAPTVKTMHDGVAITWGKVANAQGDPITYTAYLGDRPNDLRVVANVEQSSGTGISALRAATAGDRPSATVADGGDKVSLILSGLDYYHSYYFQVAAQTAFGAASQTPVQTFSLAPADRFPRAYNYPNPFSPNRGGTKVVFNAPASGYAHAELTIYSEFGRKVYERDCGAVPPGISEIVFDGRDRHGQALMNGSYVGRVRFEGPAETATFFLLVVK